MMTEKKRRLTPWICGALLLIFASTDAAAQQCTIYVGLVNHNRYAYETDEECSGPVHTVPWGNWGVNSNVGSVQDTDQFKGWRQSCSEVKVEWNSCSVNYAHPDQNCERLNFPNWGDTYPHPANGYPFTDPYGWNDSTPPSGPTTCVDQYSPCGFNQYGSVAATYRVSSPKDFNCDGTFESGGCQDLNGMSFTVRNNFMTVYELDKPDRDDLIQSMYFPDLTVTLKCDAARCYAVGDNDLDGLIDDVNNQFSPEYKWPTLYQDDWDAVCYPGDPRVPCKRIDTTIRIGRLNGALNRTPCDPVCNSGCRF
ncbi:MAG TPA: hypothetical protein VJ302_13780 [Blastocatellia bacterium]|nr:hypothetical protein [Blastocatellia bacterium]